MKSKTAVILQQVVYYILLHGSVFVCKCVESNYNSQVIENA